MKNVVMCGKYITLQILQIFYIVILLHAEIVTIFGLRIMVIISSRNTKTFTKTFTKFSVAFVLKSIVFTICEHEYMNIPPPPPPITYRVWLRHWKICSLLLPQGYFHILQHFATNFRTLTTQLQLMMICYKFIPCS